MHENRETSETPAAQPGSRSAGEGSGHTARMYVSEESHCGIVPMNHSNKDRSSSAESEEGSCGSRRTLFHLTRTRLRAGLRVSQGWASVRAGYAWTYLQSTLSMLTNAVTVPFALMVM